VAFIYGRFGVAFFESTPCDSKRTLRTRSVDKGFYGASPNPGRIEFLKDE
jgi:hypothetical protein